MKKRRVAKGIRIIEKDKLFSTFYPKINDGNSVVRKNLVILCKHTDLYGAEFVTELSTADFARIVYLVNGTITLLHNNAQYTLSKGDVFVAAPGNVGCILSYSPDAVLANVLFENIPSTLFTEKDYPVILHLSMKERSLVESFFPFACKYVDSLDDEHIGLADYLIETMLRRIKVWKIEKECGQSLSFSRKNIVKEEFLKLLSLADDEFHSLGYYADKIGVTPNYLSVLIKRETGRTVKDWIDERTERNIQRLLLHPKNYTLNDIAHIVGFSSAAQVARFFQRRMGMTCTQYRNKYLLHII